MAGSSPICHPPTSRIGSSRYGSPASSRTASPGSLLRLTRVTSSPRKIPPIGVQTSKWALGVPMPGWRPGHELPVMGVVAGWIAVGAAAGVVALADGAVGEVDAVGAELGAVAPQPAIRIAAIARIGRRQ